MRRIYPRIQGAHGWLAARQERAGHRRRAAHRRGDLASPACRRRERAGALPRFRGRRLAPRSGAECAAAESAAKVKAELVAPIAPRALVGAALESFGRLDVVVSNASSFFAVPVGAIEPSHWEELIGSNLRAPLFISQEAAPQLAKNRGAIVNII